MDKTENTTLSLDYVQTTTSRLTIARTMHPRLQQMFDEAISTCTKKLNKILPLETDGEYCNRTIDSFGGCWPDTLPGTYATIHCPDIEVFDHNAFAYRECTVNGTWSDRRANYSQCLVGADTFEEEIKYIYIFIGGFSLSLLMLLLSLAIFFRFRQLRCDRITIHKNLFISYVLTGVSWILYYVLVALDGMVLLQNPLWCQVLHVVCQYFTVCNFLWMFCEGLYLNTIMVYAFGSGRTLISSCYLVGWGLPLVLTTVYATVRGNDDISNKDCWYSESNLQWIMYGPIVLSIVVNVVFLINIVRLLITKLREMPEVAQTRKATRATLILVPLLGLQYLLFPIRPEPGSSLEEFYHITVALLVSLQGAFVSVIYCFCNGEVIALLRRKYKQHRLMRTRSLHRSSSGHGTTTYTIIDHVGDTSKRNSTCKEPQMQQTTFASDTI